MSATPLSAFVRTIANATLLVLAVLTFACGPSIGPEVPVASRPCSPSEAPFAKVTNPATSDEFSSCAIMSEAEFLSADWGVTVGGDVEGQTKFSLAVPGDTTLKFALIPSPKADGVFALTKGDRVRVTGSTAKTMVGQVIFYATDITKLDKVSP